MVHLKKRKMLSKSRNGVLDQLLVLEESLESIRRASLQMEFVQSIKEVAGVMRGLRGDIDQETVEDMMDELEEEKDMVDEITESLETTLSLEEDEELLKELEFLEQGLGVTLPQVPSHPPSSSNQQEEIKEDGGEEEVKGEQRELTLAV